MSASAGAQELRLSTRSAEAQAAFRAGLAAVENELFVQAAIHLQRAISLDSSFALARAFHAAYAPDLPPQLRDTEAQQAAADAMNASVGELLLVLALRAPAGAERTSLLKSAVDAIPGDRHAALLYTNSLESITERVRGYQSLNRRFPDFAAPYRQLGYINARELAELESALELMQRYRALQPDNPHAYHGVAQVLQWRGQFPEAARHYQRAVQLDPKYVPGYTGLAELALLETDGARARALYEQAVASEPSAAARLLIQLAQGATFIVDGSPRAAIVALTRVANTAQAAGYPAAAAQAHRHLAIVEAAFGNKASVDARVRRAESLSTPGDNMQGMFAATAYALAGDVVGARPLANTFGEAAERSASLILKRQAAGTAALVHASAGNIERAQSALESAGAYGALARMVVAETFKRSGQRAVSRALADEVLAMTETDIMTMIARQKAKSF